MFAFLKRKSGCTQNTGCESREIAKARKFLESTHRTYFPMDEYWTGDGTRPFHYVETSQKGDFKRYHFYQGIDERLIYVVLSDKERNEITKVFRDKMGYSYAYKDSISTKGSGIQHRFYRPNSHNTSITFMDDDTGKIWGGHFAMDEDME